MTRFKKLLTYSFLVAIIVSVFIPSVHAKALKFSVPRGEEWRQSFALAVDDRVILTFTVVGQIESSVHFSITYPNGTESDFGERGYLEHRFVCVAEGECILHFDNRDPSEDKLVTLNYEVRHYLFGMPQMLFLAMVIVLILLAAVAAFALLGKL
jgi:hypothetical protein